MHQYPYSKVLSAMFKFSVRQSLEEENIPLFYKHVAMYKNCPKTTLIVMHQSIPAVRMPPPPRANPRALAFKKKKRAHSPGWGHISCLNAPMCG